MLAVQSALPDANLRPFVRAYVQRSIRLGGSEAIEPVMARLGVMLEFEFAGSYEVRNYGSEAIEEANPISIIGPQTWRRCRLIIRGQIESLVIMFQPCGFHALFGMPTQPLSETGTEGHAVLGPSVSHLRQQLGNLAAFDQRVRCLDRYFAERLRSLPTLDPAYRALHLLTTAVDEVSVAKIAGQTGLHRRQLERKSLALAGVSPRYLSRISRFSRALGLRSNSTLNWTEIAHATGYYDQMHMIRDFRIFAGGAPVSALKEIAPDHLINFTRDKFTSGTPSITPIAAMPDPCAD